MHCGYEGSAILEAMHKPTTFLELVGRTTLPGRHVRGFRRTKKSAAEEAAGEEQPVA